MYRSGPDVKFVENHVPKWYVTKWSCTELALTQGRDPYMFKAYYLANSSRIAG